MVEDAAVAIDLSSIVFNFKQAKRAAPTSKVMAVVKANAYGHGAVRVAQSVSYTHLTLPTICSV